MVWHEMTSMLAEAANLRPASNVHRTFIEGSLFILFSTYICCDIATTTLLLLCALSLSNSPRNRLMYEIRAMQLICDLVSKCFNSLFQFSLLLWRICYIFNYNSFNVVYAIKLLIMFASSVYCLYRGDSHFYFRRICTYIMYVYIYILIYMYVMYMMLRYFDDSFNDTATLDNKPALWHFLPVFVYCIFQLVKTETVVSMVKVIVAGFFMFATTSQFNRSRSQ